MLEAAEQFLFGPDPIRAVQQVFGSAWVPFFEAVSLLGDTWGIIFVVGLGFWLWGRETAYALFGIVSLGTAFKQLLTVSFSVPRPDAPGLRVHANIPMGSFPSGHVFSLVVPWGLLYAIGRVPFWIPMLLAVLMSLARLVLGMHYVADVVFGILFAVLFIWAYLKLWRRVRDWLAGRTLTFYAAIGGVAFLLCVANLVRLGGGTARLWEVAGVMAGFAAGFLLEYHYVRFTPMPVSWRGQAAKAAIGLSGVLLFLAVDRLAGEGALLLGGVTAAGATLWATLGAPVVFIWMGYAERSRPVALRHSLSATE